jgi:hypothetical protein
MVMMATLDDRHLGSLSSFAASAAQGCWYRAAVVVLKLCCLQVVQEAVASNRSRCSTLQKESEELMLRLGFKAA